MFFFKDNIKSPQLLIYLRRSTYTELDGTFTDTFRISFVLKIAHLAYGQSYLMPVKVVTALKKQ